MPSEVNTARRTDPLADFRVRSSWPDAASQSFTSIDLAHTSRDGLSHVSVEDADQEVEFTQAIGFRTGIRAGQHRSGRALVRAQQPHHALDGPAALVQAHRHPLRGVHAEEAPASCGSASM
jgi:hypothetical protein